MYKNAHKIMSYCVILFLLSNVIFAQETKPESRRKIIWKLKTDRNNYYKNTVFNISLNELKELTKKYFEKNKEFKYVNETNNRLCYSSYYYGKLMSNYNSGPHFQRGHYIVFIHLVSKDSNTFYIYSEERTDYIYDAHFYSYITTPFKFNDYIYFLNKELSGKWQPNKALQLKIDRYNNSVFRAKRKIKQGEDY